MNGNPIVLVQPATVWSPYSAVTIVNEVLFHVAEALPD